MAGLGCGELPTGMKKTRTGTAAIVPADFWYYSNLWHAASTRTAAVCA